MLTNNKQTQVPQAYQTNKTINTGYAKRTSYHKKQNNIFDKYLLIFFVVFITVFGTGTTYVAIKHQEQREQQKLKEQQPDVDGVHPMRDLYPKQDESKTKQDKEYEHGDHDYGNKQIL